MAKVVDLDSVSSGCQDCDCCYLCFKVWELKCDWNTRTKCYALPASWIFCCLNKYAFLFCFVCVQFGLCFVSKMHYQHSEYNSLTEYFLHGRSNMNEFSTVLPIGNNGSKMRGFCTCDFDLSLPLSWMSEWLWSIYFHPCCIYCFYGLKERGGMILQVSYLWFENTAWKSNGRRQP